MEIIKLDDTTSTNSYLLQNNTTKELCVVSEYQSAGQGMGQNTWESERGKNLLFSILIHPAWLPIQRQYLMSMADALAVHHAIVDLIPQDKTLLTIKWPNDIYYDNRKLSGTRIDVNLQGFCIQDMVIGTGININQDVFKSDAPNPVSLKQITGETYDTDSILHSILQHFDYYHNLLRDKRDDLIIELYHKHLYRLKGYHPYRDINGDFLAEIQEVSPNGIITLKRQDGILSSYEFKEIKFLNN